MPTIPPRRSTSRWNWPSTKSIVSRRIAMTDMYHQFPALRELSEGPFSALLGLVVESAQEGKVTVRMPFHERLLNYGPPEVPVHGGALASLADFAACAAVWTLPAAQRSATISLTVNYSAPAIQSDLLAT